MEEARLLARLTALRRTIRRRLVLYGVYAVMAGGFVALLTVIAIDWLLHLPAALRVVGGMAFFAGFVWAAWRWIVAPWRTRITLSEVARRLEERFPELTDRLCSTVHFLEKTGDESPLLRQEVIRQTVEAARRLPLESALTMQPLLTRGMSLVAAASALAIVSSLAPQWLETGFYRYLHPAGEIEWPTSVSIVELTGHQTVAMGDSAVVRMRIERGRHDGLRALVHLRRLGDRQSRSDLQTMQRREDGTYTATIEMITTDLAYWFEAGDATTARKPLTIRVIERPEVTEAVATVFPPPYAATTPSRMHDLRDGPVRAPLGGKMALAIRPSKPIRIAAYESPSVAAETDPVEKRWPALIRLDSGEVLPLHPDRSEPPALIAEIPVHSSFSFLIELRDEYGFENLSRVQYAVLADPDAPPSVVIDEPRAIVETTPRGSVQVSARAIDDFGITRMGLIARRIGDDTQTEMELPFQATGMASAGGMEFQTSFVWALEPLNLTPGDVVAYSIAAWDNRIGADMIEQVGRSSELRIRIVSPVELEVRLYDDLARLQMRLRQTVLDQMDLKQAALALRGGAEAEDGLATADREAALRASADQARLVRRVQEISERLKAVTRELTLSEIGSPEDRIRLVEAARTLEDTAVGAIREAGSHLGRAADQSDSTAQQEALDAGIAAQQQAVEQLNRVLSELAAWGNFQSLLTQTRDLLERQGETRARTTELGKTLLGKEADALTPEETAQIQRLLNQQRQIGQDVEQLLARMAQLRESSHGKDEAAASTLDDALRAAAAQEVARRTAAAADALSENRTSAAAIDQRIAEEGLRKVIGALQERETRALVQLRKRLDDAAQKVMELITQQELLRDATVEAVNMGFGDQNWKPFADDQRLLARNTAALADELAELRQGETAAVLVRRASTPMRTAEQRMRETAPALAVPEQQAALLLLQEAYDELEALAQAVEELRLKHSLAVIREELETLHAAQRDINAELSDLHAAIGADARLTRVQIRDAARLAREQAAVRTHLDEVKPRLSSVPVYDWALGRVAEWMDLVRGKLEDRRIDAPALRTAERIEHELATLIKAIDDTQDLPVSQEFITAAGGEADDSGPGGQNMQKPVPPLAELLVLKTMQQDINERTEALYRAYNQQEPTEAELRDLERIGEDQAEVRRLTERITRRTAEP